MGLRLSWVGSLALLGFAAGCAQVLGLGDFTDAETGGSGGATTATTTGTNMPTSTSTSTSTTGTMATSGGGGGQGPSCGDGTVQPPEVCDGDCPTECIDPDLCTSFELEGSAATCDAVCTFEQILACQGGDGCCPAGCFPGNDGDCGQQILVLGAGGSGLTQLRDAIAATGVFGQVDSFDAFMMLPTAAQLSMYDAILVTAFTTFQDAAVMGDLLADYFDAGGRVVVTNGAMCHDQYRIRGRWEAEGYHVFEEGGVLSMADTLGTIHEPNSPLVVGVDALDIGFHCVGDLNPGATPVLSFAGGDVLVGRMKVDGKNRIDVNMLPTTEYFEAQAVTLLVNALRYPSLQ